MTHFIFGTYAGFISIVGAASLALAGLVLSTPAVANGALMGAVAEPNSSNRHISYADLNLATAAGEAALNRRVGDAVEGLCQDVSSGEGSYWSDVATARCRASAWDQATPQIGRALHRARDIAGTDAPGFATAVITISRAK